MRVRITSQARADLRQIWNHIYVSGAGPETADRVLRRLDKRIYQLADFPNRGVARPGLGENVRRLVIERWVVLYRVSPNEILIGRVIDGARNLARISFPPDDDVSD